MDDTFHNKRFLNEMKWIDSQFFSEKVFHFLALSLTTSILCLPPAITTFKLMFSEMCENSSLYCFHGSPG